MMVGLGEGDNPAAILTGDIEGMILALHIANKHLVEALHGLEYLLQMLLSIPSVDDYRYFLFIVHRCKDTKFFTFHFKIILFLLSLQTKSIDR